MGGGGWTTERGGAENYFSSWTEKLQKNASAALGVLGEVLGSTWWRLAQQGPLLGARTRTHQTPQKKSRALPQGGWGRGVKKRSGGRVAKGRAATTGRDHAKMKFASAFAGGWGRDVKKRSGR